MTITTEIDFVSVTEAARLLEVTVPAVHQRIKAGRMSAIKANGRCWIIPRREVEKWLLERKENFR